MAFIFYLPAIFILFVYDAIYKKAVNAPYFISIALFASLFVFANYRIFYQMLFDASFVPHRSEFFHMGGSIFEGLRKSYRIMFIGHALHGATNSCAVVFPSLCALLASPLASPVRSRRVVAGAVALSVAALVLPHVAGLVGHAGWERLFEGGLERRAAFSLALVWALVSIVAVAVAAGPPGASGLRRLASVPVALAIWFWGVSVLPGVRGVDFGGADPSRAVFKAAALLFGLVVVFAMITRLRREGARQGKALSILMALIALCALCAGMWSSELFVGLRAWFPLANAFNLSRVFSFLPVLWFVVFYYVLKFICRGTRKTKAIIYAMLILQVTYSFTQLDAVRMYFSGAPTVAEFFSESTFERIEKFIGKEKSQYRVACVNFYPAIALYNGFHTIGGYFAAYPVSYKYAFMDILKYEKDRNPAYESIEKWGSQLYLRFNKRDIHMDGGKLRELGCGYVLSTMKIARPGRSRLSFMRAFDDAGPYLKTIYLYEVLPGRKAGFVGTIIAGQPGSGVRRGPEAGAAETGFVPVCLQDRGVRLRAQ